MRDVEEYQKIIKIGHGTYGEVFKARHKTTNKIVALKKLHNSQDNEGFSIPTLREIKILQCLKHENIVQLLNVAISKGSTDRNRIPTLYLVLEFCEHDLAGLLSNHRIYLGLGHKKSIMKQMLCALYYMHRGRILHRDLKASNVLITREGKLKLADFGLCRHIPKRHPPLTNKVVTLWYRPPEILLGSKDYGTAIDMWGVGCIMPELWTRSAIMQGSGDVDQLFKISRLCGSITPESLPTVEELPLYNRISLPRRETRKVVEHFKGIVKDIYAMELIDKLLQLDPKARLNAEDALYHPFFWTDPMPADLGDLLSKMNQSMFILDSDNKKRAMAMDQRNAAKRICVNQHYKDKVY